jgi:hypothetical protein
MLPVDVPDIFMVPSTQLLSLVFNTEPSYQAALAKLRAGLGWSAAEELLNYGAEPVEDLLLFFVGGPSLVSAWESLACRVALHLPQHDH